MLPALLAACAVGIEAPPAPAPESDPLPGLAAIGPQPRGSTALTLLVGRPLHSLRLEHGFSDVVEAGLSLDAGYRGFLRPLLRGRVRALRIGKGQVALRGAVGTIFARGGNVLRALEIELGLQIAYAALPRLGAFGEASVLGASDLTRQHTAAFVQAQAGLAYALPGPLSLIAAAGMMQGARGSRAVGSGGASFRF